MYILAMLVMLAAGFALLRSGLERSRATRTVAGAVVLAGTVFLFLLMTFWGEMLWFSALGFERRFWLVVAARASLAALGAVVGFAGVSVLTFRSRAPRRWRILAGTGAALLSGLWAQGHWLDVLRWLGGAEVGLADPVLGRDTGFYLFSLPVLDVVYWLLLGVTGLAAMLAVGARISPGTRTEVMEERSTVLGLFLPVAAFGLVLAWGKVLGIYHLLYSPLGVVAGPGWTDVHVRLPALVVAAAFTGLLALGLLARRLRERLGAVRLGPEDPDLRVLSVAGAATAVVWGVALLVVPGLVQQLVVVPNEITFERDYIANNIEFTRRGFRLHRAEEREFSVSGSFTRQTAQANEELLSEVRLWDWRALDAVIKQFQEIRLYYEFHDVDIDRYTVADRYRQVMVSAREMNVDNLPQQSQTFVNRRFKYTHGYGMVLTTVSDFTSEGLPNMLVKDIPPKSSYPSLEIDRSEIYYGELNTGPAVVNSEEPEFDFPRGDENAYIRYPGTGGVELRNLWRKLVFGWKFDGTPFLLSTYPTPETRFMMRRTPRERVSAVAPFLELDEDPYVVLVEGRLYWIVDAYTTSRYYPYSEPFSARDVIEYRDGPRGALSSVEARRLAGANYLRNSVKAVVDAFEGSVRLYVFDDEDPLIDAWSRVFPGLFLGRDEMPESLEAHVRYPVDLLLAQGIVYAKYHMTNPEVFYNQEDLWVRATEKYYDNVQPVRPYYVMWEMPSSDSAEFVLIQPFTPKNRQVLIGWIAGMSDGENYGRFLAYKFPKEERVLGPQQVETKIDQDRFLSGQLTLWDQRGSNVIRGNVLAIPIEDTLIYVEPIYLQADTAAYPELRLVVIMHQDQIAYAESFDTALEDLFAGAEGPTELGLTTEWRELAGRAERAFQRYLQALGEKRFEEAASALAELEESLQRLARSAGET